MIKSSVRCVGILSGMSREFVENVVLVLLLLLFIGVMVAVGFLFVAWIPDFARFLLIIWYVLTV